MKTVVVVLASVALLTACGDGGEESEDTGAEESEDTAVEGFCDQVEDAVDDGVDVEPGGEEAAELYSELVDDAPEDISAEVETVAGLEDTFEDLSDLSDEGDLSEGFESALDEDVLEASNAVREYLDEECGLDLDAIEEQREFEDREPFPRGLLDFIQGEYADEPWIDAVNGAGSGGPSGGEVTDLNVSVDAAALGEVTEEDLIEMCEAAQDYVDREGEGARPTIEIRGDDFEVLASAEPGGPCTA